VTPAELLDVRGVTKSWPRAVAPTLSELDLVLEPSGLALVEGANGAGKTTLLRVIAGLIEPDRGEVRVCGLRRAERPGEYHRRLGIAASGHGGLYARLSSRRHLAFSARLQAMRRPQRPHAVSAAIERFELGAFADRRADRLSMGQRQRLRLALAFLHEPPVVLLDEPSNSLDADGQAPLERAVEQHLAAGHGVVWFVPTGDTAPAYPHSRLVLGGGALAAA
jgi:ABC-type multidrug transport system ATPase subunit